MNTKELKIILTKHKQWLMDEKNGELANLSRADLTSADLTGADLADADLAGANLAGADLSHANLVNADLRLANLTNTDLRCADFTDANLTNADLRCAKLADANLRRADLTGVDLDFLPFPLWCGSLDIKVNEKIAWQLLYHFCRLDCDSKDYRAVKIMVAEYANRFHRVDECGEI
jgi:uncharacterized protein YjbI with pentapeptide repeats